MRLSILNNKYSKSEFIKNIYSLTMTKLFMAQARFIRRPIYIRGKKSIEGGKNLTTGRFCRFDLPGDKKTLFIGDDCEIGDMVHIVAHKKVEIGNNVLMASKVFISDTSHGHYSGGNQDSPDTPPKARPLISSHVIIGDNVWIGENVCILARVTIGDGCIIGANSVITHDIPENNIVVGAPAKLIKHWEEKTNLWK